MVPKKNTVSRIPEKRIARMQGKKLAASPKTGDETKAAVKWLALFGALAAMAVSSWRLYRKESQDE